MLCEFEKTVNQRLSLLMASCLFIFYFFYSIWIEVTFTLHTHGPSDFNQKEKCVCVCVKEVEMENPITAKRPQSDDLRTEQFYFFLLVYRVCQQFYFSQLSSENRSQEVKPCLEFCFVLFWNNCCRADLLTTDVGEQTITKRKIMDHG